MAHFSQTLSLALLISSAASIAIAEGSGGIVIPEESSGILIALTPTTCYIQTNPTNSPAWNIPTYCNCGPAGAYPTITPTAISTATGNQLCEDVASSIPLLTPIAPIPFTCNLESAATGFTVPNKWCGCTAGTTTRTYSTKFGAPSTGAAQVAACDFMQDELPAGTISPTAAHCVVASANPGGSFFDQLAWCACGDDAPHPLIPATSAPCAYTTVPSSTITLREIASTSCQLSSIYTSVSSYCECDGAPTTARYPTQTAGGDPCVFPTVPTATMTFGSLIGDGEGSPRCNNPDGCYTCDYDGKTRVSYWQSRRSKPDREQ